MTRFRGCVAMAALAWLALGRSAASVAADFDFSIRYSGSSITGRLVGLALDANGNASEIDPTSVLIYSVPAIVGLPASPSDPYVFVPNIYERSTYFSGTFTSTTPGVYGFQVANYAISPPSQNLLMSDSGGDVTLVFNFGAGLCGECGVATYGIQGEEDALWPAVNSFVSFSIVSQPGDFNHDGVVNGADYVAWRKSDGTQAGYSAWRTNFGLPASGSSLGSSAAPEASSIYLFVCGSFAVLLSGRNRYTSAIALGHWRSQRQAANQCARR